MDEKHHIRININHFNGISIDDGAHRLSYCWLKSIKFIPIRWGYQSPDWEEQTCQLKAAFEINPGASRRKEFVKLGLTNESFRIPLYVIKEWFRQRRGSVWQSQNVSEKEITRGDMFMRTPDYSLERRQQEYNFNENELEIIKDELNKLKDYLYDVN